MGQPDRMGWRATTKAQLRPFIRLAQRGVRSGINPGLCLVSTPIRDSQTPKCGLIGEQFPACQPVSTSVKAAGQCLKGVSHTSLPLQANSNSMKMLSCSRTEMMSVIGSNTLGIQINNRKTRKLDAFYRLLKLPRSSWPSLAFLRAFV